MKKRILPVLLAMVMVTQLLVLPVGASGSSRASTHRADLLATLNLFQGTDSGYQLDGMPTRLHGIQVAVGTLICAKLYDKLRTYSPDPKKAEDFVAAFCLQDWNDELRKLLGSSADSMIAQEVKEQKYDKSTHPARLQKIVASWNSILAILEQELPAATELEKLLDTIGAPKTLAELGTSEGLLPTIFAATKDIRDKYVLSRLCWDLGIIEEI